jgi:hypothetical protein
VGPRYGCFWKPGYDFQWTNRRNCTKSSIFNTTWYTVTPDPKSYQNYPGGLNPDETLKLDQKTMQRLHQNYLNKLHTLHPFLNKVRLLRMFQRVSQQANPGETNAPLVPHSNSAWVKTALNKPTKRKHTQSTPDIHTSDKPWSGGYRRQLFFFFAYLP